MDLLVNQRNISMKISECMLSIMKTRFEGPVMITCCST